MGSPDEGRTAVARERDALAEVTFADRFASAERFALLDEGIDVDRIARVGVVDDQLQGTAPETHLHRQLTAGRIRRMELAVAERR